MKALSDSTEKAVFGFQIAARIREKYEIDERLFSTDGRVIFTDFQSVRSLVYKINQIREPQLHVYSGELNAAGLVHEAYHLLLREYERQLNPVVFSKAESRLGVLLGAELLQSLFIDFTTQFPPPEVYKGKLNATSWLSGQTAGRKHSCINLEELLLVLMANWNPATKKFRDLFDRAYLENQNALDLFLAEMEKFFEKEPPFGPDNTDIFKLLKAPVLASPEDLNGQLDFILSNWKTFLPEVFVTKILKGKDLMKEDIMHEGGGGGGGMPTFVPKYKGGFGEGGFLGKSGYDYTQDAAKDYEENEAFTDDIHWMPRVVLMAKNVYVWLDQLSKKYQSEISRLDQIPDEELDQLVNWNFNGLWLIGIWERSVASRRIKHIMGFIDAVSSAYSLYDYQIAHDLGGEEAYQNLNHRAKARGLRLASDMVPNHTGIFSKWVIEKPDYFIQTRVPPFPGYRFTGENLSHHPDVEVRIEDGYYSKADAAVVFQRVDKRNGDVRYIYHGNDGTNMPWNDTAQLDLIKQEVREAVIQMIFDVARRFSIIRFDAAMTLAKKHFARLWYPRPGTGGDIPSRADYAMTQAQFDALFPVEFWREVVDRMNEAMPETLLLAEAFWFMEGYFVRTLGMHRVYNSAFMHMLKNEENEKYRDLITNTLEFEPEILKRYVNFMSNPDEETAIRQFGTGDKYFGVCVLMSTLPGLPMFAHGQLEGYTEKYGMEYQRAYYNEEPQQWLIDKHDHEIFPLLKRRYLFSEVEYFNFFDFMDDAGYLNENVMAYTNRYHNERALVFFNNKYETAAGRILWSAPKLKKGTQAVQTQVLNLGEALALNPDPRFYYVIKEHISGQEYLKKGHDIYDHGMHWSLNGFEYRIFWKFIEVYDDSGIYERLYQHLAGQGVASIEKARKELELERVYAAFEPLFQADVIDLLADSLQDPDLPLKNDVSLELLGARYHEFASSVAEHYKLSVAPNEATKEFSMCLQAVKSAYRFIKDHEKIFAEQRQPKKPTANDSIPMPGILGSFRESVMLMVAYFAKYSLNKLMANADQEKWLQNELELRWPLQRILKSTGRSANEIERDIDLLDILLEKGARMFNLKDTLFSGKLSEDKNATLLEKSAEAAKILKNDRILGFIGANPYQNVWYFSKENVEELATWLFSVSVFEYFFTPADKGSLLSENEKASLIKSSLELFHWVVGLSQNSGYKLASFLESLELPLK